MSLLDDAFSKAKSFFNKPQVTIVEKKVNNVASYLDPVFRDIPPEMKSGQYATEGMRGWAFIAITAIADEIAAAELNLYMRKGKDWVEVEEHPALNLINKPNSFQTREEFFWLTAVYLLSEGEVFWALDKPSQPTAMTVLNPSKVTPVFDTTKIIGSYKYSQTNGKIVEIPSEEVICIKLPNVSNPFRGKGTLSYIPGMVDLDKYLEDYMRLFFFNSALPTGTLETDHELNEGLIKRLKKQFETSHKGVKNAHKLAVLEKGLHFNMTSFNMQQLDVTNLSNMVRDRILAAFRVPKSVVGIVEDVNRANAEASDRNFAKRGVLPKLKIMQGQMNQFFLVKFADYNQLWFEFENVVQEDELVKAQIRQANISSGVRTANEYRQEDGYAPLPERTAAPVPNPEPNVNQEEMKRAKRISRRKVTVQAFKSKGGKKIDVNEEILKVVKSVMTSDLVEPKKKEIRKKFSADQLKQYHQDKIVFSDEIEKRYTERLRADFIRQKKEVLEQLTGKRSKKGINISYDKEKNAKIMASLSIPYLEEAIAKQGGLTAALMGLDDSLSSTDDRVKAFIKKWTVKLGDSSSETVSSKVDDILKGWSEREAPIAELRKELKDYFDDPVRAEVISRTEVSRANGFATETVFKDNGVVAKEWLTAEDERVCQFCDQMDGKVIDTGDNFFKKGQTLVGTEGGKLSFDYGSVSSYPLHPSCRCDLIPVFDN